MIQHDWVVQIFRSLNKQGFLPHLLYPVLCITTHLLAVLRVCPRWVGLRVCYQFVPFTESPFDCQLCGSASVPREQCVQKSGTLPLYPLLLALLTAGQSGYAYRSHNIKSWHRVENVCDPRKSISRLRVDLYHLHQSGWQRSLIVWLYIYVSAGSYPVSPTRSLLHIDPVAHQTVITEGDLDLPGEWRRILLNHKPVQYCAKVQSTLDLFYIYIFIHMGIFIYVFGFAIERINVAVTFLHFVK